MKRCIITVTNDGLSDRRMQRIGGHLDSLGWEVGIVGRIFEPNLLQGEGVHQILCRIRKGPRAYWEYHQKLVKHLFDREADLIIAVDYDTLPAAIKIASRQRAKVIFDSHEFFEEVPELEGKTFKKWIWRTIARKSIPKADLCWTVSSQIAEALEQRYSEKFEVVHNLPTTYELTEPARENAIVYLGVLNKGRGLPEAISAMRHIDAQFWLLGEGDISEHLRHLVQELGLIDKVRFLGWISPEEIPGWLQRAKIGLNLLQASSKSYEMSLANKFFDYVQAGLPQVTMNFPTYRTLNEEFEVATLVNDLDESTLVNQIKQLFDEESWTAQHLQTLEARSQWNWEVEKSKVTESVQRLFATP